MEATSVKSASNRTPVEAVQECLRTGAPQPPKGTPLEQKAVGLGPPSDPPPDFSEAEPQRWHIGADVNPPSGRRAEEVNGGPSEKKSANFDIVLQHFLLSSEDNASCILTSAEMCATNVNERSSAVETKRSVEVAEIERFDRSLQKGLNKKELQYKTKEKRTSGYHRTKANDLG